MLPSPIVTDVERVASTVFESTGWLVLPPFTITNPGTAVIDWTDMFGTAASTIPRVVS